MRKFNSTGFIRQYPDMNNNLIAEIVKDQKKFRHSNNGYKFKGLDFTAVDTQKWTATAWCRDNENKIIFSNDTSLTYEEAFLFCATRNSTLWIPKPSVEEPDFWAKFESSRGSRF